MDFLWRLCRIIYFQIRRLRTGRLVSTDADFVATKTPRRLNWLWVVIPLLVVAVIFLAFKIPWEQIRSGSLQLQKPSIALWSGNNQTVPVCAPIALQELQKDENSCNYTSPINGDRLLRQSTLSLGAWLELGFSRFPVVVVLILLVLVAIGFAAGMFWNWKRRNT